VVSPTNGCRTFPPHVTPPSLGMAIRSRLVRASRPSMGAAPCCSGPLFLIVDLAIRLAHDRASLSPSTVHWICAPSTSMRAEGKKDDTPARGTEGRLAQRRGLKPVIPTSARTLLLHAFQGPLAEDQTTTSSHLFQDASKNFEFSPFDAVA
jgi:hypothetical protein